MAHYRPEIPLVSVHVLGNVATVSDRLAIQPHPDLSMNIVIADITIQAGNIVHYSKLIGEKY